MIEIRQKVEVYEVDGGEVPIGKMVAIGVNSHPFRNQWVIIKTGKKSYAVKGYELIGAIKNAMNT